MKLVKWLTFWCGLSAAVGAFSYADVLFRADGGPAETYSAAAAQELEAFAATAMGQRFPMVVKAWRAAWPQVVPFFAFPPDVRRVMYTTNALERVNAGVRKIIKTRGHFPNDDAALKLVWLALRNITAGWALPTAHWKPALRAFAIAFAIAYGDRFLRTDA